MCVCNQYMGLVPWCSLQGGVPSYNAIFINAGDVKLNKVHTSLISSTTGMTLPLNISLNESRNSCNNSIDQNLN